MKKIIIALIAVLGVAVNANAQKFGHVDTQSIMQSLPDVTKANGELQATAQQYENELKTMQEEIQRKADEYDKKKYFGPDGELFKKRESLMAPIQDEIYNSVKEVATTPISYQQVLSLILAQPLQMLLQLSRLKLIRLNNEENHINGNMLRLLFHNYGTTSEDWFFLYARFAQY